MYIEVLPYAGSAMTVSFAQKVVVIIDVLRATSTMVTALANGCKAIIPVLTPEEALEKRSLMPGALLGGERQAQCLEGFDFGNSPFDYVPEKVGGRRVIMTTTNGTRAIMASKGAPYIFMASFLNSQSITWAAERKLRENPALEGLVILCAGTNDNFDLPDILCAGMLIEALGTDVELNDLGIAARMLYQLNKNSLVETVLQSNHGQRLISLGYEDDVIYCSTSNILPIVPLLVRDEVIWVTEGMADL
ncbi:MAG TPA: 2-phosphosulfolactate phosphatase [Desulfitobacteriaceae bacterium]|nr:2-phosphosulfolactate phosphatase [Desulfitobacteriaceae bacterium]